MHSVTVSYVPMRLVLPPCGTLIRLSVQVNGKINGLGFHICKMVQLLDLKRPAIANTMLFVYYLLYIMYILHLLSMFFYVGGGNQSTEQKPTRARGEICKLHTERSCPTRESNL